jgi:tetratricopeptide (TPR) repeat protein
MTDKCPKCGNEVDRRELFCSHCGAPLSKATLQMHGTTSDARSEDPAGQPAAFEKTLLMGQVPDFANDIPEGAAGGEGEIPQAQAFNAGDFETPGDGQESAPYEDDGTGEQDDDFDDDWRGGGRSKKFRIIAIVAGAIVLIALLLFAIHLYVLPIKPIRRILGIESKIVVPATETEAAAKEALKSEIPKTDEQADTSAKESAAAGSDAGAGEGLAAKGNCKPISEYPDFPLREYLKTILGGSDEVGVCALFGMSAEEVGSKAGDALKFGPTGYDFLPGANVLEVYPGGRLDRRQPRIELVFLDDKLFEVHLIYASPFVAGPAQEGFDKGKFKEAFKEPDEQKAAGSIARTDFVDGDILVSLIEKEPAEKKGRKRGKGADKKTEPVSIVFANKTALESTGDADKKRKSAEEALVKGVEVFYSNKADKSKKYFAKARKQIPGLGAAYNLEARAALHKEIFKDAIKGAEEAEKSSRDARVTAEADEILSIVFAYLGKGKRALKMIEKARELDPAETRYALAIEELENRVYTPERVARAAALMSCKRKKRGKKWSIQGILARTNFPSEKVYKKELKKVKRSDVFKEEKERWTALECP